MLIFKKGSQGRFATAQAPKEVADIADLPEAMLRKTPELLPDVSELQAVRHFTHLSRRTLSIATHFYPLGSCTMKYNPKICDEISSWDCFSMTHPYQDESTDTLAVDVNNEPIRDENGLVFRPGGHGSLLKNLGDVEQGYVFIKNIDNLVPDYLKSTIL